MVIVNLQVIEKVLVKAFLHITHQKHQIFQKNLLLLHLIVLHCLVHSLVNGKTRGLLRVVSYVYEQWNSVMLSIHVYLPRERV